MLLSTIEELVVSGPEFMMVADGMEGDWVGEAGRGLLRRLEDESFVGTESEEDDDSVDAVVTEVAEVDPEEEEDDPAVMDDDCDCCCGSIVVALPLLLVLVSCTLEAVVALWSFFPTDDGFLECVRG